MNERDFKSGDIAIWRDGSKFIMYLMGEKDDRLPEYGGVYKYKIINSNDKSLIGLTGEIYAHLYFLKHINKRPEYFDEIF